MDSILIKPHKTKKCSDCQETKPIKQFYSNGHGYYKSQCKPCYAEYTRNIRADNGIYKSREPKVVMYPNEYEIAICNRCPLPDCVEVAEANKHECPLRIAKREKMAYADMLKLLWAQQTQT